MSSDTQTTWSLSGPWTPELLSLVKTTANFIASNAADRGEPHLTSFAAMTASLVQEVERLTAGIQKHHDQGGDDRCYKDDTELYALIGLENDNSSLGPEEEHLESCRRFWRQRQCPATAGQLQGMTIAQLEAEVQRLREYEWMYKDLCK
jgi:hypothetical protein